MIGLVGAAALLALAWGISADRRRALSPRLLAWGLGLPALFALVALRTPIGAGLFVAANHAADVFVGFTDAGIAFLFGEQPRFIFAIRVLPIIVFVASVMAILYHLGIMQRLVGLVARLLARAMGISGAEAVSVVGDVFLGMTEAPLVIRPYLARMTTSELFAVMTGGMATIAGSVLLAFAAMGIDAGALMTASFMNAPLAILVAKIMHPETGAPETLGRATVAVPRTDVNVIDAAARGAADGLKLALNVGAMLLAFVAIIHMLDAAVGGVAGWLGRPGLRLADLFGYALAPVAWLLGVPWRDAQAVGALFGTKTVFNELLAYKDLAAQIATLDPRSVRIATFALCGFANFGSLAIVLGGLGGMVPERRPDLARLGLRSILAGTIATFVGGALAGALGP